MCKSRQKPTVHVVKKVYLNEQLSLHFLPGFIFLVHQKKQWKKCLSSMLRHFLFVTSSICRRSWKRKQLRKNCWALCLEQNFVVLHCRHLFVLFLYSNITVGIMMKNSNMSAIDNSYLNILQLICFVCLKVQSEHLFWRCAKNI